tara:strand:- start:2840 stop:3619 length:780 start_codon:yes stop_codon:yes gene_type:complete
VKKLKYLVAAAAMCVVGGFLYPSVISNAPIVEWANESELAEKWTRSTQTSAHTLPVHNLEYVSAREKARKAAVRVLTPDGRGSGVYVKIGQYHVIVTAQHVVDNHEVVLVEGLNGEVVLGQPILRGTEVDVAYVLVPEINSRRPVRYNPMHAPRDIDRLVGKDVTYSGYPASHDLMTLDGKIIGVENGNIIIHSYGWPGSSGSGVFDMTGRMVGVVSAVDVGQWHYMIPPQLVEDIVWVAPVWSIQEKDIKAYLKSRGM